MEQYTVNFSGVKTMWDFYEALIKGLEFPEWCGKTPDAIWDLLTERVGHPAIMYVYGLKQLPKDLQDEGELISKIFKRTSNYYREGTFIIKYMD